MNKEDYVSLEVAKLLKEKGYNYITESFYLKKGNVGMMSPIAQQQMIKYGFLKDSYPRITLYEAQKWLRGKHQIHICVDFNASGWYCRLYEISYGEFILQTDGYEKSCEEALNAGILEALKLI